MVRGQAIQRSVRESERLFSGLPSLAINNLSQKIKFRRIFTIQVFHKMCQDRPTCLTQQPSHHVLDDPSAKRIPRLDRTVDVGTAFLHAVQQPLLCQPGHDSHHRSVCDVPVFLETFMHPTDGGGAKIPHGANIVQAGPQEGGRWRPLWPLCLLYTSDAADDLLCVDLGGRRIIKKKKKKKKKYKKQSEK